MKEVKEVRINEGSENKVIKSIKYINKLSETK